MPEKVVACYKWVLDEADVGFDRDLKPDYSKARSKISEYDRNAIEAAVQAAKQIDGSISVGVTVGFKRAASSLKDALSRGLEETYFVNTGDEHYADYRITVDALAKGIKSAGDVALAICAEGSSDLYGRQTASRLGVVLDWPTVTSVIALEIDGRHLKATRKLENCLEVIELELPAVLAVSPEINDPGLPGMRAIMAAKKKPQHEIPFEELNVDTVFSVKVTETKGYQSDRKLVIFENSDAAENVRLFVEALKKEGIV